MMIAITVALTAIRDLVPAVLGGGGALPVPSNSGFSSGFDEGFG